MNIDIPKYIDGDGEHIDIGHGYTAFVKFPHDDDADAPWENSDGHGPVSDWTGRDKRPGELVLCSDRGSKRYYDFAEAVRIAKRDGWDAKPYGTGTKGERAHRAALADFEHLRGWCNDEWHYVGVVVEVFHNDEPIGEDAVWCVEDAGDYAREMAKEFIESIIAKHLAERRAMVRFGIRENHERKYWESRDVVTDYHA
jgi:hypothetical protein